MPTYLYRCPVCGAERTARFAVAERDSALVLCVNPACSSVDFVPMSRVPTSANFSVKGFNASNGYSS